MAFGDSSSDNADADDSGLSLDHGHGGQPGLVIPERGLEASSLRNATL